MSFYILFLFCQRILTVILSFHLQKLNRLKTLIVLKDGLPIKKIGSFMKLKRDDLMFSTNFHFSLIVLFLTLLFPAETCGTVSSLVKLHCLVHKDHKTVRLTCFHSLRLAKLGVLILLTFGLNRQIHNRFPRYVMLEDRCN